MADEDEDYGRDIPVDQALEDAQKQLDKLNSDAPKDGTSDDPHDKSGAMHKDAGDNLPPQGVGAAEGRGEGDIPDVTQPYTPEERMQQSIDQARRSRETMDRLHARTAPMWDKYRSMLQEDQQMREQGPQDQQYPAPPSKQKQDWLGAITQFLAVAVPVAMLFGARGNGYAKGAMMSAIGAFMKNYAAGRDHAAKENWTEWREQVQAIHASNQERHQIYKDILSNKRLALDDQFKMINSVAQEFMDPTMAKASRTKDMKGVVRHLENQEKADQRFTRGADKTAKVLHPRDWQDYRQYIKDKTDGKVDPETDPEGANKIKKYTDWKDTESTATDRKREEKEKKEEHKAPSPDDVRKTLFGE